jgi:orotidine-5'-phosphate decarboxylase
MNASVCPPDPNASPVTARHAGDELLAAISRKGSPVCVGLDPVLERIPAEVGGDDPVERIERFSRGVIRAVAPVAPCVKVQSACYERYGAAGVAALERTMLAAREAGLVAILDAKRGDIGVSSDHYAAASRRAGADWTTCNGYLGDDGVAPFLADGRGAFALVRTSNPSGDAFQNLELADGRTVADAMADLVRTLGDRHVGASGYSALGAVVGATKRTDAARLRERMPRQVFLVPGYGAQGGGVDDVLPCFRPDGRGAIVTASRSVLYPSAGGGTGWESAIARAAEAFHLEIRRGLGA